LLPLQMAYEHHKALNRALDESGLTPLHWKIWALSAMGVFLDGFDLFIIGVAMPIIVKDMHPSPELQGLIGAAAVVGAMFGAFVGGRLTDMFGRKLIYVANLGLFALFSLASALAVDAWWLLVLRLLLGVGIGADYPLCASYVSEFMPARLRGRLLIGAFSFQALGMAAAAGTGLLVLSMHPQSDAWRWMLASAALPAAAVMFLRISIPESARWCMEHGQNERAASIIGRLIPAERERLEKLVKKEKHHIEKVQRKEEGYAMLFSAKYIRRTILAAGAWFLMDIASYAIGLFTPTILAALEFTTKHTAGPIAKDFAATEGSAFLDLFLIVGFLLNVFLVERWGRIRLQVVGFAGMAVGLVILAYASHLDLTGHHSVPLIFAGFILFNLLMNAGPNATTFILPAELFSTEVRASGHGFAAGAAKFGAALGIFFLPILKAQLGVPLTLYLLAGICGLGLLITVIFHVETKGKSLEELNPAEA